MSKEPKSPKGSDRLWRSYPYDDKDYETNFKATYDKLVSLEAKIEELNDLKRHFVRVAIEEAAIDILTVEISNYQSEYAQLLKEHNL
jgi:hypothetical protein